MALAKSIYEGIERCASIFMPARHTPQRMSYGAVGGAGALPLTDVVAFSKSQLSRPKFRRFALKPDKPCTWVRGLALSDLTPTWIPTHLAFTWYPHGAGDLVLRPPTSIGAALGASESHARLAGALEVIERDASMIHYLTDMGGVGLDFAGWPRLVDIARQARRYRLSLRLRHLPTEVGVHTICALLVDRTGTGPAISVGLKADLDPETAAVGAACEALMVRMYGRSRLMSALDSAPSRDSERVRRERILALSSPRTLRRASRWLRRTPLRDAAELQSRSTGDSDADLRTVVEDLRRSGYSCYAVDLTPNEVATFGLSCQRVVIPGLQPMNLGPALPCLGGDRLYRIPEQLGWDVRPRTEADLVHYPHFFV